MLNRQEKKIYSTKPEYTRFKTTQLEKVLFIKVNELKLTQGKLVFHFFTLCVSMLIHIILYGPFSKE